jgi:PAS domain S-box-containing protein
MGQFEDYSMAQPADFDFFRSILEDLHLAVYVVDRGGKIVFWNDGAQRITGYLRQDVIGRMDNDNLLGEADGNDNDLSGPCVPTAVAMREGKPIQAHRISLRHKSGHRVPVELWSFPVRNATEITCASERLRRMVSGSKIAWWGDRLPVTISVGGTAAKPDDMVDDMVLRAEQALRQSIALGGNRTTVLHD